MALYMRAAQLFVALRECLVPTRSRELNEELVAKLNGVIENLETETEKRSQEAENCRSQALHHARLAQTEPTQRLRGEQMHKAKMFMTQRRRIEASNTKAMHTIYLLRQQIDCVVSSHVDTMVIDAMRQYSQVATRLGLPDRASEVQDLNDSLQDHQQELKELEAALQVGLGTVHEEQDEDELRLELDHLLQDEPSVPPVGLTQRRPTETVEELPQPARMPRRNEEPELVAA
jgi:hypothetical protein